MKLKTTIFSLAAIVAMINNAQASESYFKVGFGKSKMKDYQIEYDDYQQEIYTFNPENDNNFSAAIGANLNDNFALEFEYTDELFRAQTDSGYYYYDKWEIGYEDHVQSYAINALYSPVNYKGFKPYAGFGLGIATVESYLEFYGTTWHNTNKQGFKQYKVGLEYEVLDNNFSVYTEYSRKKIKDVESNSLSYPDLPSFRRDFEIERISFGIKKMF
jgi:opacity protein-like surface antigen